MTETVLVVDDSLTVRMDLVEAFETAGFRAVACATAAEARAAVAKEPISVVILDLVLPDADGLDLLQELRAKSRETPVLLLSSEAEVADRIRGLEHGAQDYVGKPYDTTQVVARARALIRNRSGAHVEPEDVVLVIDDSPTFREELRAALTDAGYRVLVATNGEDGLRMAAVERPHAILVDSVMPGLDGSAVIRRVRLDAALRGIPCVLMTASEGRDAELRALDAGADAFVRKEEDREVILARLAAALRGAPSRREEDTASLLGPKRILAVDDSPTYLEELSSVLLSEGYDVVRARSGEEALAMLAAQPVDCILLDLVMPGIDGRETCRRIKQSSVVRDIPLIMLTSVEDRRAMLEGLSLGADDFITKSSEMEIVRARVRAQLRRKQFEDEHRKIRDELMRSELEERAARQIAEARAALVEELERKNRELEAFSYSVSHDLRAPLRAIDGFSLALLEDFGDKLEPEARVHLERVRGAATRMGELIEDLLELARISRAELTRAEVDLTAMARSVGDDLARTDPERKVLFTVEEGLSAKADARLVRVVFENLLGNAWKFTSRIPEPRVEVSSEQAPDGTVFVVRDNGAGFDATSKKLFAAFQRFHTEKAFPGTGIGLSIVKRIIDRHGGRIWVESAPGAGATFFFTLSNRRSSTSQLS